tara:strand:- start:55 stop:423 length:369 start_codon:yes stop_codon:yes gene_type:complete
MTATFNSIDPNRIASTKQVYGVACHFANLKAKDPSERYGLNKVFYAVLNNFYDSSKMTHAEATDFFTRKDVPKQFLKSIQAKKPEKAKKPTASKVSVAQDLESRMTALESNLTKLLTILEAK